MPKLKKSINFIKSFKRFCTMKEVTIKFKSSKTLEALKEFAKDFDLVIEQKTPAQSEEHSTKAPIVFSKQPDLTALRGVWEGRDIDLKSLRENAWGGRA